MNIFKKQLLSLFLLLIFTSCLAGESGRVQLPEAIIPLRERIEKDVKKCLQSEAEKGGLYSLGELTSQARLQNTSDDLRKELSLEYFKDHKDNLIRKIVFPYLIKEALLFSIIIIGLGILFISFQALKKMLKTFLREEAGEEAAQAGDFIIDMYLNGLVAAISLSFLGLLFKSGNNTLTIFRFYFNPAELYQSIASIEERYMNVKWYLIKDHKDYIKVIESWLVNLRMHPKRYDLVKQLTELLDLVRVDRKDGFLLWNEKFANEVLIAFKPPIRKQLKELAFNIMIRLNVFKLKGTREQLTSIFYGIPGTGKTYAAYCIAKILNIPSFQIDLGVSNETLFGSQNQRSGNLTQAIGGAISKKHGDSAICICDDGDRALNSQKVATSWQLDLLDTSKDRYHDSFFNVDIFKPIIMMFTGNYGDDLDPAASNRFVSVIHFKDPFTKQGIVMILEDYMNSLIEKYQGLPYSVTRKDFSDQEWDGFKQVAIKKAELIGDKGLRTAKHYVQEYFNKKVKQKHDAMLKRMRT